jgi:diacylglycerol kinase (ATP)
MCSAPAGFFDSLAKTDENLYYPPGKGGSMSRRCTLIINPVSGGYSEARVKGITALLEKGGVQAEPMLTGSPEDAAAFAAKACRESDEPLIAACGGDGTVNGVINGLEPGKALLAVMPFGTANVLARELAITSPEEAASRIIRGVSRPLTIGVLDSAGVERRFLLMAGVGVDGSVVERVRISEKRRMGKLAYLLAALRELLHWESGRFEVTADGGRIDCHSLIVCNAARYGGGFVIAPNAGIFDPGLHAVCITGNTRAAYARVVLSIITGRIGNNEDITFLKGDRFSVSGTRAVQVDGDYCCNAPVRIRAMEGFARLIV